MIRKSYSILIHSAKNTVWHALWQDQNYRTWTSVFSEGSYTVSDWQEGNEIQFLSAENNGMYSTIKTLKEPDLMVFEHIGDILHGEKQAPASWSGGIESYTLLNLPNGTELTVHVDVTEEHAAYFDTTFPKALAKLKELAESEELKNVTVQVVVQKDLQAVWAAWTDPKHIVHWNFATPEWHCPAASNDLRKDGVFSYTMAAKDGSFSFDFAGKHLQIEPFKYIDSVMADGRVMKVVFTTQGDATVITETFATEQSNPVSLQKAGWQAILDNFKYYTEQV